MKMDIAKIKEMDENRLAALNRGACSRRGSAKMECVLKARINYANMLLGDE